MSEAATSGGATHQHTNRLAQETSPYLLQHQHNPVDWYAWGPEAFAAARQQNKPIFLSVGYSTCYWCHVMERQSFENESVARVMNELFINIKVDREERPDVDQLYMLAVQLLTRHGGWPMSVWLMPDLRPFYGGTYFPPTDAQGRPGFVTVCRAIADAYHNRKEDVEGSATQLVDLLRQISEPRRADRRMVIDEKLMAEVVERSAGDYEPRFGGFGDAPKFPRETLLELLLTFAGAGENAEGGRRNAELKAEVLRRALHALDAMAAGGIRDHLGGGFHRYSTDAKWLVPHFEIMLYDNAMLGWCYVEAYRQTDDVKYAAVARGIFDFVLREMTSSDGAFYTALDAEVDAEEGGNYLWTQQQVREVLGEEDANVFNAIYGVDGGPNFADPHGGSGVPDKNVLYLSKAIDAKDEDHIASLRAKLKAVRDQRKQPLLDTKIITSWNALMIRALAQGGQVLGEKRYVDAAARAAEFLLKQHRTSDGGLYRASRDGKAKYAGFLDDYAFLVQALLALHEARAESWWKDEAGLVAETMRERFEDRQRGAFYFTEENAKDLIVRQKTASDSPLPSGNAVAAMALLSLGKSEVARDVLNVFARQMVDQAEGMSSMVEAALLYVRQHGPIEVEPTAEAQRPESPQEIAARVVAVRAELINEQELAVHLEIPPPFHVNAHEAAKGLIGTQLAVTGAEVESVDYPPGQEQRFAFAEEAIRVYSGEVVIGVKFAKPITTGSQMRLRLTYQACNEEACLPPVTKQVELQVQ